VFHFTRTFAIFGLWAKNFERTIMTSTSNNTNTALSRSRRWTDELNSSSTYSQYQRAAWAVAHLLDATCVVGLVWEKLSMERMQQIVEEWATIIAEDSGRAASRIEVYLSSDAQLSVAFNSLSPILRKLRMDVIQYRIDEIVQKPLQ
jgi:hypothetical protein